MISRGLAIGMAALAGCVIAGPTAGAPSARTQVARVGGEYVRLEVTFAGREILYSRIEARRPSIYSASTGRVVYQAPEVPLPARFRRQGIYESRVSQSLFSLAGAPGITAFVRTVTVTQTPKCRPACGLPSQAVPLFAELRVRFGLAPFRRIAGGPGRCPTGQFWPDDVAVTAGRIVYSGRLAGCSGRRQESRVAIASFDRGVVVRTVVARFRLTGRVQVAVAGRHLAWSRDWSRSNRPDLHGAQLAVYDILQRRVAYTVELPRSPRIDGIYSIGVQSDGTVAAELARDVGTCYLSQLVWSRPSPAARLRVFAGRPEVGWSSDLELAGDRLMFLRSLEPRCSAGSSAELVFAHLRSPGVRILDRYG